MRYFLSSFLFFVFVTSAFGQTVTASEVYSLRAGDGYQLLGKYKDKYLLYLDQFDKTKIIAHNEDMTEEWSKELEFETKNPTIIDAVGGQVGFSVFYSYWKKGRSYLRVRKYDEYAKLVDSIAVKTVDLWSSNRLYEVAVSQDRSKVLLYDFGSFNRLELIMVDVDQMKVLWSKDIKLERISYPREFMQVLISDAGDFYGIFLKDNYRFNRKKTRFLVLKASENGVQATPYPTSQKLVFDAYFRIDNRNNRLTGGGLFDEKRTSRAQGAFFLTINLSNPLDVLFSFHDFDATFVSSLLEGKQSDKKDTFDEAIVNNVILRQDGGAIVVAEKFKLFSNGIVGSPFNRQSAPLNARNYTDYNYDDIVLVSFGPKGDVDWRGTLPKKQFSQNDEGRYSSYFIFKNKGAVRFLYNDEIKRENSVSEYVLFSNGMNQRRNILNTDDKKIQLRFRDALQVAGSELIVPSQFRRDLRLVRIKY